MKATAHLQNLFEDGYDGNPWLDVTLVGTLKNISAAQAAKKIREEWHSIWEIVNHLISWRLNVLQRAKGKIMNAPPDNYFSPVTSTSETAWAKTLAALEDSQKQWLSFLKNVNEQELEKIYPGNNHSYYKNIEGIIQHDAYHLGQIVLLAKVS